MKKSIKSFIGRFVKNSEKLDEFEEEFDDKNDLIDSQLSGQIVIYTVL